MKKISNEFENWSKQIQEWHMRTLRTWWRFHPRQCIIFWTSIFELKRFYSDGFLIYFLQNKRSSGWKKIWKYCLMVVIALLAKLLLPARHVSIIMMPQLIKNLKYGYLKMSHHQFSWDRSKHWARFYCGIFQEHWSC